MYLDDFPGMKTRSRAVVKTGEGQNNSRKSARARQTSQKAPQGFVLMTRRYGLQTYECGGWFRRSVGYGGGSRMVSEGSEGRKALTGSAIERKTS